MRFCRELITLQHTLDPSSRVFNLTKCERKNDEKCPFFHYKAFLTDQNARKNRIHKHSHTSSFVEN